MDQAKFFSRDLFYIFICAYIVLQIIDLCGPFFFFLNLFRQFCLLDLILLGFCPELERIH